MSKVLVVFERNWADEFDAKGFSVFSSMDEWKTELKRISGEANTDDDDWGSGSFYFGTNEGWDSFEDYSDGFTVTNITDEEHAVLVKLFPRLDGKYSFMRKFGIFPST